MALGTPYKFGGSNAGTGSATLTFTASSNSTLGDALHLWLTSNENNFPTTCSDNAGNTYAKVGSQVTNGADNGQWYESLNSAAVTSGTTVVSAVFTNTTSSKTMSGLGCSGVAATSALDQAPTPTTGSTGSPSITSGTLAQASELCLAGVVNANAGGALTWTGSFASPVASDSQHPGSTIWGSCAALVVSSTAAVTASGSITAAVWGMVLITLEAAAPAVTTTGSIALSPLKMAAAAAGGNNTSTGSVALKPLAIAGSAVVHIVASGSLALAPLKMAGTAAETFAATGSIALSPLKMAAAAAGGNNTSTGSVAMPPRKMAGTAAETFAATGSIALAPLKMMGTGVEGGNVTLTGSIALAPLKMRGIASNGKANAAPAFVDDYRHRLWRRSRRRGW